MRGLILSRRIITAAGVANIVFSVLGLWYTLMTYWGVSRMVAKGMVDDPNMPIAYNVMATVCLAFYVTLFISGVQLIRKRPIWAFVTSGVLVAEVVYFFGIGTLWFSPIGMSVAGAAGLANGGLMFQFFVLYPIWGTIGLLWAGMKMKNVESEAPVAA